MEGKDDTTPQRRRSRRDKRAKSLRSLEQQIRQQLEEEAAAAAEGLVDDEQNDFDGGGGIDGKSRATIAPELIQAQAEFMIDAAVFAEQRARQTQGTLPPMTAHQIEVLSETEAREILEEQETQGGKDQDDESIGDMLLLLDQDTKFQIQTDALVHAYTQAQISAGIYKGSELALTEQNKIDNSSKTTNDKHELSREIVFFPDPSLLPLDDHTSQQIEQPQQSSPPPSESTPLLSSSSATGSRSLPLYAVSNLTKEGDGGEGGGDDHEMMTNDRKKVWVKMINAIMVLMLVCLSFIYFTGEVQDSNNNYSPSSSSHKRFFFLRNPFGGTASESNATNSSQNQLDDDGDDDLYWDTSLSDASPIMSSLPTKVPALTRDTVLPTGENNGIAGLDPILGKDGTNSTDEKSEDGPITNNDGQNVDDSSDMDRRTVAPTDPIRLPEENERSIPTTLIPATAPAAEEPTALSSQSQTIHPSIAAHVTNKTTSTTAMPSWQVTATPTKSATVASEDAVTFEPTAQPSVSVTESDTESSGRHTNLENNENDDKDKINVAPADSFVEEVTETPTVEADSTKVTMATAAPADEHESKPKATVAAAPSLIITMEPSISLLTNHPTSHPTSLPTTSPSTMGPTTRPATMEPTTDVPISFTQHPTHENAVPSMGSKAARSSPSPTIEPKASQPSPSPTIEPTTAQPSPPPTIETTTAQPSPPPTFETTTALESPSPTLHPTTRQPTGFPTSTPSNMPTSSPTVSPTIHPTTMRPTSPPTSFPSNTPTPFPTQETASPTMQPTIPAIVAHPSLSPEVDWFFNSMLIDVKAFAFPIEANVDIPKSLDGARRLVVAQTRDEGQRLRRLNSGERVKPVGFVHIPQSKPPDLTIVWSVDWKKDSAVAMAIGKYYTTKGTALIESVQQTTSKTKSHKKHNKQKIAPPVWSSDWQADFERAKALGETYSAIGQAIHNHFAPSDRKHRLLKRKPKKKHPNLRKPKKNDHGTMSSVPSWQMDWEQGMEIGKLFKTLSEIILDHYFDLLFGTASMDKNGPMSDADEILAGLHAVKGQEMANYYQHKSDFIAQFYAAKIDFSKFPQGKAEEDAVAIGKKIQEMYDAKHKKKKKHAVKYTLPF